jgi:hypothetical protein
MTNLAKDSKNIQPFEKTYLVRVAPKEATLPIDVLAEMTDSFILIDNLIKELSDTRYKEEYIDESGHTRQRIMLHPQLISYMGERRKMLDQAWKISGAEAEQETKKEVVKSFANAVFKSQSDEIKNQYKKEVMKIIEEDQNGNSTTNEKK